MASTDTIQVERRDRVAILSFNRPSVLNAFDGPLVDATVRAMAELSADESVLAIVVRGEGRAFSAGFDLKAGAAAAGERKPADWRRLLEADFDFIMTFWESPKPTIAAIHGYCLGGAFELSLACDISVAASGTRLGAPEVKFGSGAVALLLPFVTGAKAAKEILLTGDDHLSAERALALGIVNHVVPEGEELPKALAIAESIAAADPMAVQLSKRAVNRSYEAMGLKGRARPGARDRHLHRVRRRPEARGVRPYPAPGWPAGGFGLARPARLKLERCRPSRPSDLEAPLLPFLGPCREAERSRGPRRESAKLDMP